MSENDQLRGAFHEAGHAVIGRVLGVARGPAGLVGEEGQHRAIEDPWPAVQLWLDQGKLRGNEYASAVKGRLLAVMAGAEAELEFFGDRGSDGRDRFEIARLLQEIKFPRKSGNKNLDWETYEARLRRRANSLVKRHHLAIERVALALIKQQTLDGGMIDTLVTEQEEFPHEREIATRLLDLQVLGEQILTAVACDMTSDAKDELEVI